MDFSRTFIAIRKRSLLGLFDLTLLVYRDHFRNILLLLLINALPWMLLDFLVLWFADVGYFAYGDWHWKILVLTVAQAQVGTMMVTLYLGKAMFEGKPSVSQTVRSFLQASWYGIWLHGAIRMIGFVMLLLMINDDIASGWAVFLLFMGLFVRMVRPFVSEIMLLEQTPIRQQQPGQLTFGKRSGDLHRGGVAAGFFIGVPVAIALTVMVAGLFFHIDLAIGLLGTLDLPIQYLYWPIAAWLVASLMAVFRFLHYINTRISQEGWEVSLKVLAEGQKLDRSLQS